MLWGITTYFNPVGYATKLPHLQRFAARVRAQQLPLLVVELAYGDAAFEVPDDAADRVVRVRSDAVLWQRERLVNIGVAQLPAGCDKVLWLDADLLFGNDRWVADTSQRLDDVPVVQIFETACYLPRGVETPDAPADATVVRGIGATLDGHPDRLRALADYLRHGHTGFGWAFRRADVARHGLYDALVVGGADIVMAHAFYGDAAFFEGRNWYTRRLPSAVVSHAAEWAAPYLQQVEPRVGFTPGTVYHLWHGDLGARQYTERLAILREEAFDPRTDLRPNADGCWTWGSDKAGLHARVRDYFLGRREDG